MHPEAFPRRALGLEGLVQLHAEEQLTFFCVHSPPGRRGAGEPCSFICHSVEVSWALGWGHQVLSRADSSLSFSGREGPSASG